jgi:hypothetical protein
MSKQTTTSRSARLMVAVLRACSLAPALTLLTVAVLVAGGAATGAAPAAAAPLPPVWQLQLDGFPTNFAPGATGDYKLTVRNVGDGDSIGPVTVHVSLPYGVTASSAGTITGGGPPWLDTLWECPSAAGAQSFTCSLSEANFPSVPRHFNVVPELFVSVDVDAGAVGVAEAHATVEGGGAAKPASAIAHTTFSSDPAPFGISSFGGAAYDQSGAAARQAGSHPDLTTTINFNTKYSQLGSASLTGNMKDVRVDLPPGLVGNPTAVPTCSVESLSMPTGAECPAETQIGTAAIALAFGGTPAERGRAVQWLSYPVYNARPAAGSPARFAFNSAGVVTNIDPFVVHTAGGYGVAARVSSASQTLPFAATRLTLWGVPAAPWHDRERRIPNSFPGAPSTATPKPLFTTPTECSGKPLLTTMTAVSWQDPLDVKAASFSADFDGVPLVNEGCAKLAFDPSVTVVPTVKAPDAPTGLDVKIASPQNLDNPDGLASAQLRDVRVTLPEGMTINPGAADGLGACTDDQLGLDDDEEVSCPESAKIGTVTAKTPLLTEELSGGVYIRSQASDDPESGDMFRMALVLENKDRGILVKLAGQVRVNKDTGRIVAEFKNNPQVPVEEVALSIKSGPRAPLATPTSCGKKTFSTQLTSWSAKTVDTQSSFTVSCTADLGAFRPSLTAGTVRPVGGALSPFTLNITKPDGNTDLNGLRMEFPTGLLANLKGNLNTQVGTVNTYAGPGSNPFMLPGKVYLEGRYGDAPFSLRVVVPAKAGPFDLGEVVVRQKIYVDPIDGHVTVVSDPIPTIVKGVPVRLQRLEVNVDKPDFIINPTSCAAKTISATLSAVDGQSAAVTNRFQVGECSSLALKPDLALSLSGKGQTTDGKHPAITANLVQKPGQANLKKVKVTLPLSMALDPDNANGLCEFVDGSKVEPTCPKASIVGTATATTPILDEPLSGPVYFVKNIRKDAKSGREIRTLPKLVIPLVGQNGVKLTLTGTSAVEDDQLVTTFENIPDAPVSSFKLSIIGGKGGILTVSGADICKATQIADQQITGQNNKSANADVYIQTPSCPLKVLSKKVAKSSVMLKIGGLGAGKVTVTGHGIKKTTKTITKSTVATITAKRTKGTPGKLTVSFDPTGPAKVHKTTK